MIRKMVTALFILGVTAGGWSVLSAQERGRTRQTTSGAEEKSRGLPASFPYDAILAVGEKPEGLEVPGLDLALRARKAWELLDQGKAYRVILSGKEFNNTPMLKVTGFRGAPPDMKAATWYSRDGKVDRSKEERIKACEMIAIMLGSRGVGRLAMTLRPGADEVARLCEEKGWKKVLCVGDGAGPEKSAADRLKAAGVQVEFSKNYDHEEGKRLLSQDFRLTPQERSSLKLDYVKPEEVHFLLVKGGPGDLSQRLLTAIKLYQSGYGKYILPAGGGSGYMSSMGEVSAIVCGGFGIPIDRVIYGPGVKSTYNFANAKKLAENLGLKEANVYCPQGGTENPSGDVKFWGTGMLPYKVLLPRDHDAKVKEVLAEMYEDIAKCEKLIREGTAEEKVEAEKRLKVLSKGSGMTQLSSALQYMNGNKFGGCGRSGSFPFAPWDWDGVSSFSTWYPGDSVNVLGGAIGWIHPKMYAPPGKGGAKSPEAIEFARKYIRQDYGVKGPWQDYMDAKITSDRGTPQWWDKYVKPDSTGAREGRDGGAEGEKEGGSER